MTSRSDDTERETYLKELRHELKLWRKKHHFAQCYADGIKSQVDSYEERIRAVEAGAPFKTNTLLGVANAVLKRLQSFSYGTGPAE